MPDYRLEYERRRAVGDARSFNEFLADLRSSGWFERQNKLLIKTAILIPESTKALMSFEWCILTLDQSKHHELLTSDRPLVMTDGISQREGHIALPIGPKKLFVAARNRRTIQQIDEIRDLGRSMNDLIVTQAFAQVFGTTRRQLAFVENRLRKQTT